MGVPRRSPAWAERELGSMERSAPDTGGSCPRGALQLLPAALCNELPALICAGCCLQPVPLSLLFDPPHFGPGSALPEPLGFFLGFLELAYFPCPLTAQLAHHYHCSAWAVQRQLRCWHQKCLHGRRDHSHPIRIQSRGRTGIRSHRLCTVGLQPPPPLTQRPLLRAAKLSHGGHQGRQAPMAAAARTCSVQRQQGAHEAAAWWLSCSTASELCLLTAMASRNLVVTSNSW